MSVDIPGFSGPTLYASAFVPTLSISIPFEGAAREGRRPMKINEGRPVFQYFLK
jgi:hypothetical protein